MATANLRIVIDPRDWGRVIEFITTVQEIAGTTNDPITETNLYAAIDKLFGKDSNERSNHRRDQGALPQG